MRFKHLPAPAQRVRRLILHIGAAKTGSTAIQAALAANRGRLADQGVLYPTSLGLRTHSLMAICAGSLWDYKNQYRQQGIRPVIGVMKTRQAALSMLAAEVDASRAETLIISSEGLFTDYSDKGSVQRLKRIADALAEETQVVVFLRRQDEALLSHFVHGRRLGHTKELLVPEELRHLTYLDYHRQLTCWSAAFGTHHLGVQPFRRDRFAQGDIVHWFLACLGIDASGFQIPAEVNLGLDTLQEEFLQRLNVIIPRFHDGQPNKLRGDSMMQLTGPGGLTISDG
ncbi:hypothetical protein [uncultured Thiodictyon sp.]|uniref:hypothetical protein n=1 Tax=uncultured Thiodictyon sp. TaxID=1846217 RepID=UPI0025FEEF9B|nr:hypothetical protein [uncultured Thiodictyon sp.]